MKWKIWLAVLAALAIMASASFADTLTGGSGGFQAYQIPNQDGTPYWDGISWDAGTAATVGNFLTTTGWFSTNQNTFSPGLTNPQWWGNNDGTAATTMSFTPTPNSGATTTILVEVAGYAGTNTFGWYLSSDHVRHELFTGSNAAPNSNNFTPSGAYGFYIGVGGTYYYMDSASNSADQNQQHFAIFRPLVGDSYANSFFIGAEDLPIGSGDKDFQDMIVRVSPAGGSGHVPLPPSALLLGSGLLGLLALGRRRRNGKS